MVKVKTVGMIEHNAKSFPDTTAHADMINGALVGLEDKATVAPASGSDLYVVMNEQTGDYSYADTYDIAAGEKVNLFALSEWIGQELEITEANITYAEGEDYSSISEGTELTFDADTFKFAIGSATAGDIGFTVIGKFGMAVNAVVVKIHE